MLLAVLCAAPAAAFAQDTIEWSLERRLTKGDFKGRVPAAAQNGSMSAISIDASWECERGALVAAARATFDPSKSWWRNPGGSVWGNVGERMSSSQAQQEARRSALERDMQLLDHEQLHFDIAEVVVRKIKARLAGSRTHAPNPAGLSRFSRWSRGGSRITGEQQRYDRETGHGVNARAQEQWKRRIRALLN